MTEVAITAQFEPVAAFGNVHAGLLWSRFRDRFPKVEEHPLVAPIVETADAPFHAAGVRVEIVSTPGTPRFFFLNESGTELVQIQSDRFSHNWRKIGDGDRYPRYEKMCPTFAAELNEIDRFLRDEKLGGVTPSQCEITYVNQIDRAPAGTSVEISDIIAGWPSSLTEIASETVEDVRFELRRRLRDSAGAFRGRLYISIKPAIRRSNGMRIYVLELTARGQPAGSSIESAIEFLDFGRESLAIAFAEVTTEGMQREWGRQDGS